MRTAICISGLARTFRQTYAAFAINVLAPLRERGQVDIFISVWDDEGLFEPNGVRPDLTAIYDLYKPAGLDVESFAIVKEAFQLPRYLTRNHTVLSSIMKNGMLVAMPAQYKVLRCNAMKSNAELGGGFKYDLVMRTRFDVDISRLDIDELDLSCINCLYDHHGLMGDYLYMGPSSQMDALCALFNNYQYLLSQPDTDMGPERTLKYQADHCGLKTKVMKGYTYALVRDTHRQEFWWNKGMDDYRPVEQMVICSALYYPGSLARGDLIVRDNRFYPGKYSETFLVWWAYIRKNYPDLHVILFADSASPIPIQPLLDTLPEPYDTFISPTDLTMKSGGPRVHVRWLSEHSGQYFRPMQRNLVEGIITAYELHQSWLWVDNDAFLNTDARPIIGDNYVAAPNFCPEHMTVDSVCTYISHDRLHQMDQAKVDLPTFLRAVLASPFTETRMHTLQEGGLYKLFAYGSVAPMKDKVNLTHLSCYSRFMAFLRANPLSDCPEYHDLIARLEGLDMTRLAGVEMMFLDMWEEDKRKLKEGGAV